MRRVCVVCGNPCYGTHCWKHKARKKIRKTPLKKKPYKKKGKSKDTSKQKPLKILITALDRVFSTFIRLRDADKNGYVYCFTSGKRIWWKASQNGHFASRRHNATRFHEENCHAQSRYSNLYLSGEQFVYGANLDKKYGDGKAEEIMALSKTSFKFTEEWLTKQIEHYTKQVKILKEEKGL